MRGSTSLTAVEGLILERAADGRFVVRGELPAWCTMLRRAEVLRSAAPFAADEVFPFLAAFLPDAEEAWRRDAGVRPRVDSDLWTEVDASGGELHLEATAFIADDAPVLVITRNDRLFLERQELLQRARELRMTHSALMKEIEHKDILVHAIVHDLAAPLHSIIGVLSLLDEQPLAEPLGQWVALATQAANRQRELITEILDVFAAESGERGPRPAEGVDLLDVVERVIAEREPVARRRNIQLCTSPGRGAFASRVVGEETRLFRVLTNLLDNAFRHSPTGGTVRVSARREDGSIVLVVEDDGPGVPLDIVPRLFEKFARGRELGAGTGLGLFYCRITLENWGGGIGYERREAGGATFWIRLRALPAPSVSTERMDRDGQAHAGR